MKLSIFTDETGLDIAEAIPLIKSWGLKYVDLSVIFRDGRVTDYSCSNFKTEAENKKYFKDNVGILIEV